MKRKAPLKRSTKPIARTPIKRKPRPAKETQRIYGSKSRIRWVKSLPCAVCGVEGFSENAHVGTKGHGMGRKANADQIAPLCGPHYLGQGIAQHYEGCHTRLHRIGSESFEERYGVSLANLATKTDEAWRDMLSDTPG